MICNCFFSELRTYRNIYWLSLVQLPSSSNFSWLNEKRKKIHFSLNCCMCSTYVRTYVSICLINRFSFTLCCLCVHDRNDIFLINWRAVKLSFTESSALFTYASIRIMTVKTRSPFCNSIFSDKADFRVITWIMSRNCSDFNISWWWHGIERSHFSVECSYSIIKWKNDFSTKHLLITTILTKIDTQIRHSNDNLTVFWHQVWLTHVLALDLFLLCTTLWNIESEFGESQCNHVLVLRISWFKEIIRWWRYHLFSSVIEIEYPRWKCTYSIWHQVLCYNLRM